MVEVASQKIFDFSPGYRPGQATSKLADEKIVKSGQKATQCQMTYQAVRNHCNGGTSAEIAKAGGVPHKTVWRRLSSLRDHDYLREGKSRKCKVTNNLCKTWWICG